jgi:hypothetical protein
MYFCFLLNHGFSFHELKMQEDSVAFFFSQDWMAFSSFLCMAAISPVILCSHLRGHFVLAFSMLPSNNSHLPKNSPTRQISML